MVGMRACVHITIPTEPNVLIIHPVAPLKDRALSPVPRGIKETTWYKGTFGRQNSDEAMTIAGSNKKGSGTCNRDNEGGRGGE